MLKMAAIGTVADIVPLLGENRVIAKLGLAGLARPTNPGLKALIDVAGLKPNRPLTAYDVGFRLGPRINATKRMDTARDVIDLFTTDSSEEAARLATKLNGLNADRQQTEAAVVAEILEQIGDIPTPREMPFVVVAGAGWHAGVIGIVASRVVERYHRPTLILSIDEATGMATGSGRTIKAYHILEGLDSAAELFERYGGHQHAAGCSLAAERIPELTRRLCAHAGEQLRAEDFVPTLTLDARLNLSQIEDSLMADLERLEPHGSGNPSPVFSCEGLHLADAPRALKEKHLKLKLANGHAEMAAIGWRMGHFVGELAAGMRVDAAFSVEEDAYWGGWRLNLKDLKPQASAAEAGR
jgi:single-stranded-DNA-specific exonuclease